MSRATRRDAIQVKVSPALYEKMSRGQLEQAIALITESLKGPMPDIERALLAADRRDMRAALAEKVAAL